MRARKRENFGSESEYFKPPTLSGRVIVPPPTAARVHALAPGR